MKKKLATLILLIITLVFLNDYAFSASTSSFNYSNLNISEIPENKTGVILGTSKYTSKGLLNLYYLYRLQAAKELFDQNKIQNIIVSGDNATLDYNEPVTMQKDLIELGIPEDKIYLDYAGFRTLDSVIRAKKVFNQDSFTIISQKFHNERALVIAKLNDIDAVAYNAKDVPIELGIKVLIREKFARIKTVFDLLFGSNPKFLGEEIEII